MTDIHIYQQLVDEVESYISSHSDAKFSHGICPDCLPKALKKAELDDKQDD